MAGKTGLTTKGSKGAKGKRSLLGSARFQVQHWKARAEELKLAVEAQKTLKLEEETKVALIRSTLRTAVSGAEYERDKITCLRTKLQMVMHELQHVSRATCFMLSGIDRELVEIERRMNESVKYTGPMLNGDRDTCSAGTTQTVASNQNYALQF